VIIDGMRVQPARRLLERDEMGPVLRQWLRELRAIGAQPGRDSLERLLSAPSFAEQALAYASSRAAEGVARADVVRELEALLRVVGPRDDVLEAIARVAGAPDEPPPVEPALALLEEKLLVLDLGGQVTIDNGTPDRQLADRVLSTGKSAQTTIRHGDRSYESEARPLFVDGKMIGAAQVFRDRSELARLKNDLLRTERELSALQARLLRSGHLQALADVAAGAALALNNELNAIALAMPLLRASNDPADRGRRMAAIEATVHRAAVLVDRVQQVAAPRRSTPARPLDVNAAVMEALDLVRPELTAAADDRRVRVDARLGEVPPAIAQPALLRELTCNLLVQARDAMPAGALLLLRTRRLDGHVEIELRHPIGKRLDELPLQAARELARSLSIDLEAWHEGNERVVALRLPEAQKPKVEAPAVPAARRVLVVDDDAGNRETLSELLQLLGHEAVAVGNACEALELIKHKRFDAALLDLAMPEINGWELARRLREEDPRLRLAIVTGWEEVTEETPGLVEAIFRKPLEMPALERFLGGVEIFPASINERG
jgi:CheY-like chemotaxis protein